MPTFKTSGTHDVVGVLGVPETIKVTTANGGLPPTVTLNVVGAADTFNMGIIRLT